ncbi:uncharacterized protein I206_105023 [Kwoniella pini CBS 10737]|uniref:Protein CWC15 n=1 Tax=Kwoniella pini CBS 10737 TaxID=1296096 RepID=A0A1B9I8G6_9TREE|nr:protein CWC15 [Kwoniella pini CBS 10737]OCF51847.1 protein CWC15 [Kwoniella pini CBS 10737]
MSQAHRPTWNPTQGRETKAGSQQISKLSLASHTKLKFRKPGQTNSLEVSKRDLKSELLLAERNALEKKRKLKGLPPLQPLLSSSSLSIQENNLRIENGNDEKQQQQQNDDDDESKAKRRKVLEEAVELDKDESSEEEELKVKENDNNDNDDNDDDDDDSDDSDDEDDTAALMAELAKIKQERAEEKAKQDAEAASSAAVDREAEIALGNPLLNLQAALGQSPSTPSTPASSTIGGGSFTVKRRWDDDLIFKNQASGLNDKSKKGEFVNDLLRSEFHKKFMNK